MIIKQANQKEINMRYNFWSIFGLKKHFILSHFLYSIKRPRPWNSKTQYSLTSIFSSHLKYAINEFDRNSPVPLEQKILSYA